jgi:hypothetical protein
VCALGQPRDRDNGAQNDRQGDRTTITATGPVIALEIDFATGKLRELHALTSTDRARAFDNDDELRRFARMLADAHQLVAGACVPRGVRRDLAAIIDALDALLHGDPHLEARPRAGRAAAA